MILQLLLIGAVPAILVAAAVWDLTTFKIPNVLPAALVALFAVFVLVAALTTNTLSVADIGWHAAAMGAGLVAGMLFFALGWIGGGDAKLFAAACLWIGWDALPDYAVFASLFGGALTLTLLALRRVPLPAPLLGQAWILKLTDRRSGIPYGVALSAAALAVLSSSDLIRVAAGS